MLDLAALRVDQKQKASQLILHDDLPFEQPLFVAGADVGFEDKGAITRAAIAILSYPQLELVEYKIARIKTEFPYIPGFLSYREFPALYQAWLKIERKPQLVVVDGHGVAHPRGIGIASHFGLLVNIPTIGVAKKRLYGNIFDAEKRDDNASKLVADGVQIGWVWQSKKRCNPLYISAGYKISCDSALSWIKRFIRGYRLPEPTRFADAIASRNELLLKLDTNGN